jgi:hypothetical protein
MKILNWLDISRLKTGDMTAFLRWLNNEPQGAADLGVILDWPPDSNKLSGIIRGLIQLEFVVRDKDYISISNDGRRFCKAENEEKMALMRGIFLDVVPVRKIMELLERSFYGRLPRRVVADFFKETFGNRITDIEIQGFIEWAHESALFRYDKVKAEIFCATHLINLRDLSVSTTQSGLANCKIK